MKPTKIHQANTPEQSPQKFSVTWFYIFDLAWLLWPVRRALTWEPGQNSLPLWVPLVTVTTQPPGYPSTWGLSTHVTKKAQALGPAWAGGVEIMSLVDISRCPWSDSGLRGCHPRMFGCQWLFAGQGWDTVRVSQCKALPTIEPNVLQLWEAGAMLVTPLPQQYLVGSEWGFMSEALPWRMADSSQRGAAWVLSTTGWNLGVPEPWQRTDSGLTSSWAGELATK